VRRFVILVTVVLLVTATLVASAGGAQGLAGTSWTIKIDRTPSGVAVDPAACESPAGISPIIGWRNGTCWVFHVGQ
jgi:hypothetical protein